MSDLYVKEGDIGVPFLSTLTDNTGEAVNLAGSTVAFLLALPNQPPKVNTAATIVDPATGAVSYTSGATDLDTVGTYFVEWRVTFSGGLPQTFPGNGYNRVAVGPNVNTPHELVVAGGAHAHTASVPALT